jgi:o-succinylbenzoate---CoA ligase
MPSRPLVALEAPQATDDVLVLRRLLDSALMGNGPALVIIDSTADAGGRLRQFVSEVRPRVEGSTALVVPTSGSTGRPRLVKLSASALLAGARCTHQVLGGPGCWLLALPLSHIAGQQVLVRSLAAGLEPVVVDQAAGFRPDAFASAVARLPTDRPTYTAVVPTQLSRLLDADPDPLRRFDAVLVGGAPAAPSLIERAGDLGVSVVLTYGMTETCGGVVYDGRPLPGTEVELDTWGRIRLRGPTVFSGYLSWADPAGPTALRQDTWFTTADLGRFHEDGRLEVIGRTDDVVITGGVNVAPAAVEAALADHPGVAQVCVIGRPDPRWGEAVTAIVQPQDVAAVPSLESLREFAGRLLPPPALPIAVIEVPAIPLLPSGKPDRVALRALLGGSAASAPE